jgi:hypothetical protein
MQGFAGKHHFDTNLVCLPRQQQAHFAFAVVLCLPVLFLVLPHYPTNNILQRSWPDRPGCDL